MIDKLIWDTDFFGIQIGKLNGFEENYSYEQIDIVIKCSQEHFDLTYLTINPENKIAVAKLESLAYPILDKKATFVRKLSKEVFSNNEAIKLYNLSYVKNDLLSLALQSGEYSRYKLDSNFPANSFENLYTKWIENSVNKKLASHVFIFEADGQTIGFITLAIHSTHSEIGLLAVSDSHRGKGIGKQLLDQAFYYSYINNVEYVQVVTQLENLAACNLYRQKEFKLNALEYIYHIWKK